MARPRVAAGVMLWDEEGRVLLVRPSYKPGWDVPGGYVEPGESPRQACAREIREELGVEAPIGPLLVVDWAPHPAEGDKILFVFDGGLLPREDRARIHLDPVELTEYRFVELADVGDLLIPRLARRLLSAASSRLRGAAVYVEHGLPPKPASRPEHGGR